MLYALTGAVLGVAYLTGFLSCALLSNAVFTPTLLLLGFGTAAGFGLAITLFVAAVAGPKRAGLNTER